MALELANMKKDKSRKMVISRQEQRNIDEMSENL